jgi:hypothetical protein
VKHSSKPRRRLTEEELRIWRDYIETADKLRSELARRLQQESALSPGDYAVMLALSEAENRRMRSSELATAVGWERSRLSHHLGRMEKRRDRARSRRIRSLSSGHGATPGRGRRAVRLRVVGGRARRGRHPHTSAARPPRSRARCPCSHRIGAALRGCHRDPAPSPSCSTGTSYAREKELRARFWTRGNTGCGRRRSPCRQPPAAGLTELIFHPSQLDGFGVRFSPLGCD